MGKSILQSHAPFIFVVFKKKNLKKPVKSKLKILKGALSKFLFRNEFEVSDL